MWYLIIILISAHGQRQIDHLEFSSQQRCEEAQKKMKDAGDNITWCVQK